MSRLSSSILAWNSSIESNTTARPRCFISAGVAALGLMIAPRGARLPRRTAMPALALNGASNGLMTSVLKFSAPSMLAPTVLPLAVTASRWSRCAISFITTGRPPA